MQQKGWGFLTFLFLFTSPLFSDNLLTLSKDRQWQQLLHFRDGKSEIDSPNFFLSPKGKTDALAELEATVDAIYHDSQVFCRFPARVKWLFKHLPILESQTNYKPCQPLEALREEYKASKAVLVFPTAHINSPASMFGHSFLRLDDQSGRVLTANAINYAAKTAETNGLVFAYQGLFGGYEGRYSVLPYYKKIKEYNHLERRDIWEYTLNLNKDELDRMLDHLYELKDTYADYFFFTENCSYNLLWLLEVARPDADLVEQFHIKAIPIDTIRAIKEAGFLTSSHFRPSKSKRMLALLKKSQTASSALKEAYRAELGVEQLQLRRSEGRIEKKPYVHELMQRLAKRSKLPKVPKLEITPPSNPLLSHKSTRIMIGANDAQAWQFGLKLAFHDIYDVDKGFTQGAYIDFFHLIVDKRKGKDARLVKLDLVNINSYAIRDALFDPISWGVAVGAEDFQGKTHGILRGEVGVSYALGKRAFGFAMLAPKLYYHDSLIAGIGPKIGLLASFNKMKLGLQGEEIFYSDGTKSDHLEAFSTLMVGSNTALNLKLDSDKITDTKSKTNATVSLFYYF